MHELESFLYICTYICTYKLMKTVGIFLYRVHTLRNILDIFIDEFCKIIITSSFETEQKIYRDLFYFF